MGWTSPTVSRSSADDSYLLVAETGGYRVRRLDLVGPNARCRTGGHREHARYAGQHVARQRWHLLDGDAVHTK